MLMAIVTPDILPGEPGYIPRRERTAMKKAAEKKAKRVAQTKETKIGKIKTGSKGYRIGRSVTTPRKEKKYPIWRYGKKIGEIIVSHKDTPEEEISLEFTRLGGIGNYKHLIQDADFQLEWATREQELLMTQNTCHVCKKKISKSAIPHLYHYNLFKKRAELLERAEQIPEKVVEGKMTIEEGWETFNKIIEEGNRYYMSLEDTALVCSNCAKQKGLDY
jgi:hypothetical protein